MGDKGKKDKAKKGKQKKVMQAAKDDRQAALAVTADVKKG